MSVVKTAMHHQKSIWLTVTVTLSCLIVATCRGEVHPAVTAGIDSCEGCNMVIDTLNQACGYVRDGEFVSFDSPGCLLRSYDELRQRGAQPPDRIFFADYETAEFALAEEASFLHTEHLPTVMGAGVLSFASVQGAEALRSEPDEKITDWTDYRRLRGQPDAIIEAVVTPSGLSPEVVEVSKGDLVLFKLTGSGLDVAMTVTVRGYPEIGPVVVSPTDESIEVRFFATRPGMGFPILGSEDLTLGMIKVTGSHTADEEAL